MARPLPDPSRPGWAYIEMVHPDDVSRASPGGEPAATTGAVRYGLFGHDLERGVVLRARCAGTGCARRLTGLHRPIDSSDSWPSRAHSGPETGPISPRSRSSWTRRREARMVQESRRLASLEGRRRGLGLGVPGAEVGQAGAGQVDPERGGPSELGLDRQAVGRCRRRAFEPVGDPPAGERLRQPDLRPGGGQGGLQDQPPAASS